MEPSNIHDPHQSLNGAIRNNYNVYLVLDLFAHIQLRGRLLVIDEDFNFLNSSQ